MGVTSTDDGTEPESGLKTPNALLAWTEVFKAGIPAAAQAVTQALKLKSKAVDLQYANLDKITAIKEAERGLRKAKKSKKKKKPRRKKPDEKV